MKPPGRVTRRAFVTGAAAMGATVAWGGWRPARSRSQWVERRDLFVEGVASGDPGVDSVLLWTRASAGGSAEAVPLTVEVAEDPAFERVIATARTRALAAADHTCRVLVGGLRPAQEYWYRFTDESGRGSRIGRTRTAAAADDPRPVRFAFVSCQNVCEGAQNAYRRMIFEDERAAPEEQLGFVLHLGDFIYEVVEYPEDRPGGHRYDRRLRDIVRFPQGEKVGSFRVPVTLDDYRSLYRAYLRDPDLQDARARWPFVAMWDNHEFSWMGWQTLQQFGGKVRPAQTRKVFANQAWFEYQPARVTKVGGTSLERFDPPAVKDAPVDRFDENGLSREPNNLAAIQSLTAYRSLHWGKHLELLITDQHSYRSEEPSGRPEAEGLTSDRFPGVIPTGGVGGPRRRPSVRGRAGSGHHRVRRHEGAELPPERATPDRPRSRAEGVVPGATSRFARHLEGLGQLGGHARLARGPAEPARRPDQVLARRGLCVLRRRW